VGSSRRSQHKPLQRNIQRRGCWRRTRKPRAQGTGRLAQIVSWYSPLPGYAVSPHPPQGFIFLLINGSSYGQYILWPYGYDCALRAENDAQHRTLATRAQSAIRAVSGTAYTIGPSCSTLYATTGSSTDYTDVQGNATYSYTYELRDTGTYGFTLPANQIRPTVVETWAGVVSMLKDA
jgi:hypothetical protein